MPGKAARPQAIDEVKEMNESARGRRRRRGAERCGWPRPIGGSDRALSNKSSVAHTGAMSIPAWGSYPVNQLDHARPHARNSVHEYDPPYPGFTGSPESALGRWLPGGTRCLRSQSEIITASALTACLCCSSVIGTSTGSVR